ncbi:ABC transporter permease [Solirubrobacter sp. CPCC 204708]|uniref:ABC transporter permease n=1 Tax=Solirubrobacter deserti TaxID=2282478 RepID=A0ABT4RTF2_9ACTN|nr:ABC transporter permease [Solirubrobacter deserti]MBE2315682.1 ABC transporter permease [Solirubrobacter deserti]MDA0141740.1 ABC transporter permease [Solirubrobacter deserti]
MNRVLALALSEVRILGRNKLVLATALLLPLALGAMIAADGEDGSWGGVVAMQFVFVMLFCVYATATTSLAARRRQLVLKRLRSGELSDPQILAGLLLPLLVLAGAQSVLLLACAVAFGAPLPERPLTLVPAYVLGSVMSASLALATAAFTASAELAQVTVAPVFLAAITSAAWALSVTADAVTTVMHLTPGGGLADLVRQGWEQGGSVVAPAAGLIVWTGIGYEVSRRCFRWEPRR